MTSKTITREEMKTALLSRQYITRFAGTGSYFKVWATSENEARRKVCEYEGLNPVHAMCRVEIKRKRPSMNDMMGAITIK